MVEDVARLGVEKMALMAVKWSAFAENESAWGGGAGVACGGGARGVKVAR